MGWRGADPLSPEMFAAEPEALSFRCLEPCYYFTVELGAFFSNSLSLQPCSLCSGSRSPGCLSPSGTLSERLKPLCLLLRLFVAYKEVHVYPFYLWFTYFI